MEFEPKAFWRCLYPHAIPLAQLILRIDPDYFEQDFQMLAHLGNASTMTDVLAEINSLRTDSRMRSKFVRDVLRIRVSGKRVLKLARELMR